MDDQARQMIHAAALVKQAASSGSPAEIMKTAAQMGSQMAGLHDRLAHFVKKV